MLDPVFAHASFFLFFGLVWLWIYVQRKDLRQEMLLLSFLCAPLGPLGDYFFRTDYYFLTVQYPDFWVLESLLIGFVYGGVACALYAELRHLYFRRFHGTRPRHPLWLPTLAVGGSLAMFIGMEYLHINSIYVSIAVMCAGALSIVYFRPDLFPYAVGSGVALAVFSGFFYLLFQFLFTDGIALFWNLDALRWGLFFGIPVEELFWAFSWGFLVGPAYEFQFTAPRSTY
jgi:hypothetical protein